MEKTYQCCANQSYNLSCLIWTLLTVQENEKEGFCTMEDDVLLPDMCAHTRAEFVCFFGKAFVHLKADSLQGPRTIQFFIQTITH